MRETCDVAVVGAGASGLTAARGLVAEGLDVIVLEARDRVGGRLWTRQVDGFTIELGGQWISPEQTTLLEMIDELGLETFSRHREGDNIHVDRSGTVSRFTDDFPVGERTRAEIATLVATMDDLAHEIDAEAPWAHPRAAELDSISWRDWLSSQTHDETARELVSIFIADGMLTKPSHAISLLQALLMAASAGGFTNLVDDESLLDQRVVGGLQLVPLRIAGQLGGRVRLSQPVRHVAWSDDDVVVTTDSTAVDAKAVVVAVPPSVYATIAFEPALPGGVLQMHQHLSMGLVIKVQAGYDRPFWRSRGLSGTAFGPHLALHEAYDNTGPDDRGGLLVGFVSDAKADAMLELDAEARRSHLLDCLATYFGPEALDPAVYAESEWADEEWTRGAYAASFDLGGLSRYGSRLREPVGPIHWSTSDLAGAGYQHVDGAIRIGRQTAVAVAERLRAADLSNPLKESR